MTESPESAPAGWYNDPHSPGHLRYFDGEAWTNHFHDPDQAPDVGSWINRTFAVFADHWLGAAVLAFGFALLSNVVSWFGLRSILGDLVLRDESIANFSTSTGVMLALIVVFGVIWQGLGWLALNRFMQRAHFQAEPSVGEALSHAFKRVPRFLAVIVPLAVAFGLLMVVIAVAVVIAPVLGVLLGLLALVGLVWVFVKLTFVPAALAAAPVGTSVLAASAGVSKGRFWGIAGRVIAFTFALAFASNIVTAVLGDLASPFEIDAFASTFEVVDDELVINDFQFATLFPSTGKLMVVLLITSVLGAITTMITTSAFMRLYLDSGGPSEL